MLRNRQLKRVMVIWFGFFLCWASVVLAAGPGRINYQGKLTDNTGEAVSDGTYTMRFYLFDEETGGSQLWNAPNGEQQDVMVTGGICNVQLGANQLLESPIFENGVVWLEVAIYNPDTAVWETLSPRQQILSTAYSFQADNALTLEGLGSSDFAPVLHAHSGDDLTSGLVDDTLIDPDIARDSEITWSNLSGIPTDIADGDQVGVATETDPTVDPAVKDGVSWGELGSIPAGFADGVDDDSGGDITGINAGNGLNGGGTSGTVILSVDLPFSLVASYSGGLIRAYNNYSGPFGYGVYGTSSSSSSGRGVYGYVAGAASQGVFGYATGADSQGVYGYTTGSEGQGVHGEAVNIGDFTNYGGHFLAAGSEGRGVYGEAAGISGTGVYGNAANTGDSTNYGGYFTAAGRYGRGVHGYASGSNGRGVYGEASNTLNEYNYGGYFTAAGPRSRGVYGVGTYSGAATNYGGYFAAYGTAGTGVYGTATGINGKAVVGVAPNTAGVNYGGYFSASILDGQGVHGHGDYGVYGEGGSYGVYGYGSHGVHGEASGGSWGVYGSGSSNYGGGVYGYATYTGSATNYGGYFRADGTTGRALYGYVPTSTGYAGYFVGRVYVSGYLSKPGGGFKIDHPLEPDNKNLNHSFVESPDMMNMYNGNVVLDHRGEAWVELPDWFEALNRDFRYQLTCIGGFAQVYIAKEIVDNRFKIAGGEPQMKISWQVTGIRQDPWANANRPPVEEDKMDKELGYYLHPDSYGQPEEKSIEWARDPEGMQRMKEKRERLQDSNS